MGGFGKKLMILLYSLLMIFGYHYERATDSRQLILVAIMLFLILLSILKTKKNIKIYYLDGLLILGLNYWSRFNINIVFITLFYINVIACFLSEKREDALKVSYLYGALMAFHFYQVLEFGTRYELITQMIFLELTLLVLTMALYYLKLYEDERQKTKELLEINEEKRVELEKTMDELKNQNLILEDAQSEVIRLTRIAERAMMSGMLHDTVGHEITGLIMQIEMIKMEKGSSALIEETAIHAREVLKMLRKTVSAMETLETGESIDDKLKLKIKAFSENAALEINYSTEIELEMLSENLKQLIYRTILECLTNTARHSGAKRVFTGLSFIGNEKLLLKYIDDGNKVDEIKEGNGIRYIKERAESFGGTVDFKCSVENGFEMVLIIPKLLKKSL